MYQPSPVAYCLSAAVSSLKQPHTTRPQQRKRLRGPSILCKRKSRILLTTQFSQSRQLLVREAQTPHFYDLIKIGWPKPPSQRNGCGQYHQTSVRSQHQQGGQRSCFVSSWWRVGIRYRTGLSSLLLRRALVWVRRLSRGRESLGRSSHLRSW